jgi:hypothetical protein
MTKSLRKNPGWKLEQATIDIVAAARSKLGLTNAEVIDLWANAWQKEQAAAREPVVAINGVAVDAAVTSAVAGEERPTAQRVETPYQIERREKLERLRAELERGSTVKVASEIGVAAEAMTFPFKVLVNGQPHEVVEYKGRRVLECVWPGSRVMMKNLTPQETVIFWKERVKQ